MLLSHWHFIEDMPHSLVLQFLLVRSSSFKLELKRVLRVTFLVIFPSKVDPLLSPYSFFFFSYTPHPVRLIPPFSSTFKTYLESSPFFPFPSLPPWPSHYCLWPRWLQYPLVICFPAFVPYTHTLCSSLIDLLINSSDASCPSLITCLASAWNVGHLDR